MGLASASAKHHIKSVLAKHCVSLHHMAYPETSTSLVWQDMPMDGIEAQMLWKVTSHFLLVFKVCFTRGNTCPVLQIWPKVHARRAHRCQRSTYYYYFIRELFYALADIAPFP